MTTPAQYEAAIRFAPGQSVVWTATVSNYGHTVRWAAKVLRVGRSRVTIRAAFDGKTRSVKPENLAPVSHTPEVPDAGGPDA